MDEGFKKNDLIKIKKNDEIKEIVINEEWGIVDDGKEKGI
jgi:hypothetical protein